MSVSLSQIHSLIDERLADQKIAGVSAEIRDWKTLKKENPKIYNEQVDIIFDELHPY